MNKIKDLYYLRAFGYEFIEQDIYNQTLTNDQKTLYHQVLQCKLCHLSKQKKHAMIEKHIQHKALMIVSDFADKNENESGELLDSKWGEKLKYLLKKYLNLDRKDFYMSYIFKCFNAYKDTSSLQTCIPYWFNEFALVAPKIVLCLGKDTFCHFGFENFTKLRGEIFAFNNSLFMPNFDMDYLVKNPSSEAVFIQDLHKLKGIL
ncbi:uracil-DNA glycosylase family protein [Campylobacter sp. CCS1377]|uniref:Uracil-DNA glycosylase family protein n=1 Tax=Campylobacter sp. CCS1377 TaxID=3158229 RepID=A0AAU7E6N1_9BACT|nr:hypothetical protein [Campylobacter jejuni]